MHKVDLTVLDIGWTIMQKVDNLPETCDYLVLGIVFSLLIMFTPTFYRIYHSKDQLESLDYHQLAEICMAAKLAFGHNWRYVALSGFCTVVGFGIQLAELKGLDEDKHGSFVVACCRMTRYGQDKEVSLCLVRSYGAHCRQHRYII